MVFVRRILDLLINHPTSECVTTYPSLRHPTVTEVPTKAKVERAKVRGEEMTNSAAR